MGSETGELDHEDSVGPWPLFPRRKRESGRESEKRRTYGARGSAVEQEDVDEGDGEEEDGVSFLGGCLQAEEAGALGDACDASKRHQGTGDPYTRHSRECLDDMPRGTTECSRCSRLGTF